MFSYMRTWGGSYTYVDMIRNKLHNCRSLLQWANQLNHLCNLTKLLKHSGDSPVAASLPRWGSE